MPLQLAVGWGRRGLSHPAGSEGKWNARSQGHGFILPRSPNRPAGEGQRLAGPPRSVLAPREARRLPHQLLRPLPFVEASATPIWTGPNPPERERKQDHGPKQTDVSPRPTASLAVVLRRGRRQPKSVLPPDTHPAQREEVEFPAGACTGICSPSPAPPTQSVAQAWAPLQNPAPQAGVT